MYGRLVLVIGASPVYRIKERAMSQALSPVDAAALAYQRTCAAVAAGTVDYLYAPDYERRQLAAILAA